MILRLPKILDLTGKVNVKKKRLAAGTIKENVTECIGMSSIFEVISATSVEHGDVNILRLRDASLFGNARDLSVSSQ